MYILSVIGLLVFIFFTFRFIFRLGQTIEIRDIMVFLALLQYIVGPVLSYQYYTDRIFYYMAVPEKTYMDYTFWATISFIVGLYLPFWKKPKIETVLLGNIKKVMLRYPNLGISLIIAGFFFEFVGSFVPFSLKFFIFLLSGIKFVGLYLVFINNWKYKWIIFIIVFAFLLVDMMAADSFHEFILWMLFSLIIISLIYKPGIKTKLAVFVFSIFGFFILQAVKYEYRYFSDDDRYLSRSTRIERYMNILLTRTMNPSVAFNTSYMQANITRVNQGWIIARILYYVPKHEPFADGETIKQGLQSVFMPRIFFPNKITAKGSDLYDRFTGRRLSSETSMKISIPGEAYANYDVRGGIIFMFFFGLFFNIVLFVFFRYSLKYPIVLLFLPIIFFQVIKAEADFVTVINHFFKSVVVVWIILVFMIRYLKLNLF